MDVHSLTEVSIALGVCGVLTGVVSAICAVLSSYPSVQKFSPMFFGGALGLVGLAIVTTANPTFPALAASSVLLSLGVWVVFSFMKRFITSDASVAYGE